MKPYRKRLMAGWNVGKKAKGDREERQYSKAEIKEQLAEAEENYLTRYHKASRTKNVRARLEYRIHWYEQALAKYKDYTGSFHNYVRSELAKAKKKLEEL